MSALARAISLRARTSFGVGGRALRAYAPETIDELASTLRALRDRGERPFVLGGGCNTLFPDADFSRPVVLTEKLRRLEAAPTAIRAEAGVQLGTLVNFAVRGGLGGLEMFAGIPGTVGGAVAMNAGGSGHEFGHLVRRLTGVHPETCELVVVPGGAIPWRYRGAELNGLVVAEVELALEAADPGELKRRLVEFMGRKKTSQPLKEFSAGCVFKNPPGHSAAALIDRAGMKGATVGSACVSPVHANFIVNADGKARSADVLELIRRVRERVQQCFELELELELVVPRDADTDIADPLSVGATAHASLVRGGP